MDLLFTIDTCYTSNRFSELYVLACNIPSINPDLPVHIYS